VTSGRAPVRSIRRRGLSDIAKALEDIGVGISCLAPENLTAPWILYEAGGLSKTIDDKTRLCTFLLGGLKPADIAPPLGQFQHTVPEKEDTRKLVHTINRAVSDEPMEDKRLDGLFDQLWPSLEKDLRNIPASKQTPAKRFFRLKSGETVTVLGTSVAEEKSGVIVVLDGDRVVARYDASEIEGWQSYEEPPK
jgi:hypothetical protein